MQICEGEFSSEAFSNSRLSNVTKIVNALIAEAFSNSRLSNVTRIVKEFENPKLGGNNDQ